MRLGKEGRKEGRKEIEKEKRERKKSWVVSCKWILDFGFWILDFGFWVYIGVWFWFDVRWGW